MKPKIPKSPKPPKPPKKSALQKRIEDPSSGYWKKLADKAWSSLIHTWYVSCAVCDWRCSGPLEAHHAIHRARLATRHDPKNGILLCSKHHQWSLDVSAHIASLAFAEWLQINRPRQWEWACCHKYDKNPVKPDYKSAMERLIQLKQDYLNKASAASSQQ